MGLDLSILPIEGDIPGCQFSHSILKTLRDSDVYDLVAELDSEPIDSRGLHCFKARLGEGDDEHTGYGAVHTDEYDDALQLVDAAGLGKVMKKSDYARNKAIGWYLSKLPPGTKCALFWE